MKEFKLSKKSWHFKLYKLEHFNGPPENFCSYFWSVIIVMIKMFVVSVMLIILLYTLITLIVEMPFITLGLVSYIALIISLNIKIKELRTKRPIYEAPGFFKLKYMAIKGKYCPKIKWVG